MRQRNVTAALPSAAAIRRHSAWRCALAFGVLAALFSAGCQNQRYALEKLEEENFLLGERINELEAELMIRDRQLAREFRSSSYDDEDIYDSSESVPPKARIAPEPNNPMSEPGGGPTSRTQAKRRTVSTGPMNKGPATTITIDPMRTAGLDEDPRPGDEGVLVAIEARDSSGRVVAPTGAFDVALWDDELLAQHKDDPVNRNLARLAVWKFDAQATAASIVEDEAGNPAVEFKLIWPNERPKHKKLHIYVRYAPPTGQPVLADAPVEISFTGRRFSPSELAPQDRAPRNQATRPSPLRTSSNRRDGASGSDWGQRKPLPPIRADGGRSALASEEIDPRDENDEADVLAERRDAASAPLEASNADPTRPTWKPYR